MSDKQIAPPCRLCGKPAWPGVQVFFCDKTSEWMCRPCARKPESYDLIEQVEPNPTAVHRDGMKCQ